MTSFAQPCDDEVIARLDNLRAVAPEQPDSAAEAAWQWLDELATLCASDKDAGRAKLDTLFEYGHEPKHLDGPTEGRLIALYLPTGLDEVIRFLSSVWIPWQGKVFDAESSSGHNILANRARWPAKIFWPLYHTTNTADGRAGFKFEMRIEPGVLDPETDVMAVDYKPVRGNPGLVIGKLRDELVEVVPGTYLGKVLYRSGATYSMIGYIGLRSDAPAPSA